MTKSGGNSGLVTFTEEILNGKLHFLCSVTFPSVKTFLSKGFLRKFDLKAKNGKSIKRNEISTKKFSTKEMLWNKVAPKTVIRMYERCM